MNSEKLSQEFRLNYINKERNYLIEEINKSDLVSKKHKKNYVDLNNIDQSRILVSAIAYWMCSDFCLWFFSQYSYC